MTQNVKSVRRNVLFIYIIYYEYMYYLRTLPEIAALYTQGKEGVQIVMLIVKEHKIKYTTAKIGGGADPPSKSH